MSDELDDFEYAFTRRAIRQIKAEAWDEGYDIAIRDSYLTGGHGKSPNPHRKES